MKDLIPQNIECRYEAHELSQLTLIKA